MKMRHRPPALIYINPQHERRGAPISLVVVVERAADFFLDVGGSISVLMVGGSILSLPSASFWRRAVALLRPRLLLDPGGPLVIDRGDMA